MKQDQIFKENQRLFFNSFAKSSEKNDRIFKTDYDKYFWRYNSKLFQDRVKEYFFQKKEIKSVLDCGCGEGEFIFLIKEVRPDIKLVGLDISEERIKIAKNIKKVRGIRTIDFVVADAENIPDIKERFDAVLMINLLHHLPGFKVLDEIKKILKEKGRILIIDLTGDNPFVEIVRRSWKFIPEFVRKRDTGDLISEGKVPQKYCFSSGRLRLELINRGFKIINEKKGHLFLFLFIWFLKVFPFFQKGVKISWFQKLEKLEDKMLNNKYLSHFAHVVELEAVV